MRGWVRIAIVGAAAANALVVIGIGGYVATRSTGPVGSFMAVSLTALFAMVGAAAFFAMRRLPRPVAGASAAMCAHGFAIVAAIATWLAFNPGDRISFHFPVWNVLPPIAFGIGALAILCMAALPPRRAIPIVSRTGRVILAQLLCLGLLLPFATRWWPNAAHALWDCPVEFPGILLAASGVCAAALLYASERFEPGRITHIAAGALLAVAVLFTPGAEHPGTFLYANAAHLLIGGAALALAALVSETILRWRLAHPRVGTGGTTTGRAVSDDGGPIGWVEHLGWLRGMRATTTRFRLETAAGPIEIPAGARLDIATPTETATLAPGERITVLPSGAEVTVTGLATSDGGPFRGAAVANATDLVVTAGERHTGRGVALWLWRPFVLYLAVTTVIALPPAFTAATPYDADGATESVAEALGHGPTMWSSYDAWRHFDDPAEAAECLARRDGTRARALEAHDANALNDDFAAAAGCWTAAHLYGCPSGWNLLAYTETDPYVFVSRFALETHCRQSFRRSVRVWLHPFDGPPLPRQSALQPRR